MRLTSLRGYWLTLPLLACSPSTTGLGDDVGGDVDTDVDTDTSTHGESESGGLDADESTETTTADESSTDESSTDESSTDESTDGDACDFDLGAAVTITLAPDLQPCADLTFDAYIDTLAGGQLGLRRCTCDQPCMVDAPMAMLSLGLPDPDWLPPVAVGECYEFRIYSETIAADQCKFARLDMLANTSKPWYSIGDANDHLDENGFKVTVTDESACADLCASWQPRTLTFEAGGGSSGPLSTGEVGSIDSQSDDYDVIDVRSLAMTPTEDPCAPASKPIDANAWVAKRTGP